jgi:hypothetical protein
MDTSAGDITTAGVASAGAVKSLWQTDSVALKCIMEISWGLRAPGAVAHMSSVLW